MTTAAAHYAVVVLVVFFTNVLPAFGPPTWVVLVLMLGVTAAMPGAHRLAVGVDHGACQRLALGRG